MLKDVACKFIDFPLHNFKGDYKRISCEEDLIKLTRSVEYAVAQGYSWVALDIEHSKNHSYFGLICLIQLTVFDGEYKTFLIDVLMIDRKLVAKHLGAQIIGNERIIKVLHGCIFSDLWWLARDFGVVLNPVFDT